MLGNGPQVLGNDNGPPVLGNGPHLLGIMSQFGIALHVRFGIMSHSGLCHSALCRIQGYVVWHYLCRIRHYVAFGLMSFGYVSFGIMSFGVRSFGVMSFGIMSVYRAACWHW